MRVLQFIALGAYAHCWGRDAIFWGVLALWALDLVFIVAELVRRHRLKGRYHAAKEAAK